MAIVELNFSFAMFLMATGIYIGLADKNIFKKLVGISVFQSGALLCYITTAYNPGAKSPLIEHVIAGAELHHPLPHVLMLTAIVVGVSSNSLGLAIALKIWKKYKSVDESVLRKMNYK